ncbi:MAG TPA: aminoglycoside phosphotransferase family protein [Steroidobacteraceae bacterium]|nr:aminoglycoside phosphotransferase family protein [Steroidobacteraceae bacterium]
MSFVAVERHASGLLSEVSADRLADIARSALGERTRLATHHLLGDGHFTTSYLLECEHEAPVVLRLAPEPTARLWRHERALLQRQCSVQPVLESVGPIVPRLLHMDFSRRVVPRDWALFEWRPGESWESVAGSIDAVASARLWRQFGGIVREVHAQRGEHFGYPAPCQGHAGFGEWFTGIVDDLATDLTEQNVAVAGLDRFRALLREERWRFDAVDEPRLVHGDLWQRNVLVEPGPQGWHITGLLDAERAFFGDPAAEWIFGFLDIPEAFWEGYGRRLTSDALDSDARWRRCAYQARGALYMMLEGVRFGFDATFAHEQFARFSGALEPARAVA